MWLALFLGSLQADSRMAEIIKYVLIQPKLPPHSIGRIVHKADALISKVRQPPSISGCQVRNPPLIKGSQWGSSPSSVSKGDHNQINACKAIAQIPVCFPTKVNSFIKKVYNRMPKQL